VVVPLTGRWEPRRTAADMRTDVLRRITDEDITQVTEAVAEEFAAGGERFALAVRGANDGLWDWDVRENVMHFSRRWHSMLGYEAAEVAARPSEWFQRIHPEDLEGVRADISAHLEGDTSHFEAEHRIRHTDGRWIWVLARGLACRDERDWAYRIAGSMTDISRQKEVEEQLLHQAFHDPLTDLPNRALFMDRLTHALRRLERKPDATLALLFLDIDRFKVVNDSLGHGLGDELLRAVARRLQRAVRPGDTVARLGGDEFTILVEDIEGVEDAIVVADRIQVALNEPFDLLEHRLVASASIGIAMRTPGYRKPEELLRDADLAMYRAKSRGRARHEIFTPQMHSRAMKLMELESALRTALERNEFRLHYQPIVDLADGRLEGFEALIRWEHPTRGLVSPGDFLPVAEESGLIVPIGEWVMREACRQAQEWSLLAGPSSQLHMSINLSGRQLMSPTLVQDITEILAETRVDPGLITLEITENVVMEQAAEATALLQRLKALGVRLHMDDFGTGYSSLAYLRRFPLDTLKIDRSFVNDMTDSPDDAAIVQTIITLASTLKLDVIAEGIEKPEQIEQLRALGCRLGQGYHFSKPLPASKAVALVRTSAA
jgi:diguanylate cyclase (GGDEF)-like protein/PAS domain S-box-containing protein